MIKKSVINIELNLTDKIIIYQYIFLKKFGVKFGVERQI